MKREDRLTFTISQAAKMLGVVPATIRNWEKSGLITPMRTTSNYRCFTLEDMETLKKIKTYSNDKRMGIQAIKMLLPNSSTISDLQMVVEQQKEPYYSKKLISEKWRDIRKQQGYTLEEVSKAVGISVAHLSNLERGGNVSLDLLNKLAHFYRESPLYFLKDAVQDNHLIPKGSGERFQLKEDPGIEMTSLVGMRDHVMYPVLCTVEPGSGNTTPHTHNGEEMVYVLSGVVEYRLNDDPPYILHPGDTFYYRGSDLHSWQNISNKPAKLLWVHSTISKE